MKVVVSTSSFGAADADPLRKLEGSGAEVVLNGYGRTLTEAEAIELLHGAEGLIAGTEPLTRSVLEASPDLRAISRVGAGIDNVDIAAARERQIEVRSTPDAVTDAAAELTLAGMLALLRHVHLMHADMVAGSWRKRMGSLLTGKTVGIVGYGRVGRRVAGLLEPFGVERIAYDTAERAGEGPSGVSHVPLDELLARSDIVTLHAAPRPPATLIGEPEIARLKEGAYVLNVARGGLVDELALAAGLDAGRLAGAYLDTFEREPYEGPLRERANVLLTPHAGSYAREARARMEAEAVENLLNALAPVAP
jgi:D-3-phosphoglycerate dehydrogenase / 2-oxoglutarate reductase